MDLMDLKSVVAATKGVLKEETQLHGLVNTAGIMAFDFQMTKDNYESQFQANYISHWVLTYHLLPLMIQTAPTSPEADVPIVNLTSIGHRGALSQGIDFKDINQLKGGPWSRYGQSKSGNILHAKELEKRYGPSEVSPGKVIWTASVHPGAVDTDLNTQATGSTLLRVVFLVLKSLNRYMTPDKGSHTSLFAVASKSFTRAEVDGYFVPTAKRSMGCNHANDTQLANRLWEWTENEMQTCGILS